MIWAVFMGDLNHINPPVVPLFKGGQALGKSQMVPVWKVFSGKFLVSGTNARRPFFLSAVPLFFQKGDYRGIPLFEKLNDLCHMHVPFPFFVIFRLARHV